MAQTLTDLVTLVIKAPNQQISDQTIQCHVSWSIKKLKGHLSEVYPSKPKLEEQKLIYSGQLLSDGAILKDVLRTYEGQENHTVHLVCASKLTPMHESKSPNPTPAPRPAQENQPNPTRPLLTPSLFPQQNYYTYQTPDSNADYQQFLAMQQAYAQYISQYMSMMQQPEYATTSPPVVNPQGDAHPNAQVFGDVNNNEDMDDERRDWLDHLYYFLRFLVLFSLISLYASPIRFIFVVFVMGLLYMYYGGIYRNDINRNPNLNNGDHNREGAEAIDPVSEEDDDADTVEMEQRPPSPVTLLWIIVKSFFSSLIPEPQNGLA